MRKIWFASIMHFTLSVGMAACIEQSSPTRDGGRTAGSQAASATGSEVERQLSEAVKTLTTDKDTVARANAATTLGQLGEKHGASLKDGAVPSLIRALQNDNIFVKKTAACALIKFGPHAQEAIPILRENLTPLDSDVAWCAAEALGAMGEIAHEAAADLARIIGECQAGYLENGPPNMCEFATKALGEIGPAAKTAIPKLESLLGHANPKFRIQLAVALIRIEPTSGRGLQALGKLLKHPNADVRRQTIWDLKDIGTEAKPAEPQIRQALLTERESDVRLAADQLLQVLANK